jgi:hypothetical protein
MPIALTRKSGSTDEIEKAQLLSLLGRFDDELEQKIILVAVGGTALTLLDAKPSTLDIDFTAPSEYIDTFDRIEKGIPHGFKIDRFKDGAVFTQILPDDYLRKSEKIKTNFRNIDLRALQPLDIVASKIGRLDERDKQDIETCIHKFGLSRKMVERRARQVGYAGNDEIYEDHLEYVLKNFFH